MWNEFPVQLLQTISQTDPGHTDEYLSNFTVTLCLFGVITEPFCVRLWQRATLQQTVTVPSSTEVQLNILFPRSHFFSPLRGNSNFPLCSGLLWFSSRLTLRDVRLGEVWAEPFHPLQTSSRDWEARVFLCCSQQTKTNHFDIVVFGIIIVIFINIALLYCYSWYCCYCTIL
jgi:hypothetical protein